MLDFFRRWFGLHTAHRSRHRRGTNAEFSRPCDGAGGENFAPSPDFSLLPAPSPSNLSQIYLVGHLGSLALVWTRNGMNMTPQCSLFVILLCVAIMHLLRYLSDCITRY